MEIDGSVTNDSSPKRKVDDAFPLQHNNGAIKRTKTDYTPVTVVSEPKSNATDDDKRKAREARFQGFQGSNIHTPKPVEQYTTPKSHPHVNERKPHPQQRNKLMNKLMNNKKSKFVHL